MDAPEFPLVSDYPDPIFDPVARRLMRQANRDLRNDALLLCDPDLIDIIFGRAELVAPES